MSHESKEVEKVKKRLWQKVALSPGKLIGGAAVVIIAAWVSAIALELGRQVAARESEQVDPLEAPIMSAVATVEVFIKSDKEIDVTHADKGGHLAFVRGNTPLLYADSPQSHEKQMGDGRVVFRGKFAMDSTHAGVGERIRSLRNSEYAEISFLGLPAGSEVLGGKAVLVINGNYPFEFSIPPQHMKQENILAPDAGKSVEIR